MELKIELFRSNFVYPGGMMLDSNQIVTMFNEYDSFVKNGTAIGEFFENDEAVTNSKTVSIVDASHILFDHYLEHYFDRVIWVGYVRILNNASGSKLKKAILEDKDKIGVNARMTGTPISISDEFKLAILAYAKCFAFDLYKTNDRYGRIIDYKITWTEQPIEQEQDTETQ